MDYEKKDFRKLYEDLVKSDWFKKAYHNKSLGECPFDIPELPDELEEAAEKYANRGISSNADPYEETIAYQADKDAFKAGAEWMSGQGETQEHFVIGSIAGSPCGPVVVCYLDEFEIGDEVIVQIRKK